MAITQYATKTGIFIDPNFRTCNWLHLPTLPMLCAIMCQVGPWASYQIRKIAGCACAGNARNVFPRRRFQRKLLVSDPGMHHGTCVTHVPWCMSGSLACGDGENVPGIPRACAPASLRIWQEAHVPIRLSYINKDSGTLPEMETILALSETISFIKS